jgi:putative phosphoribosyl transferase
MRVRVPIENCEFLEGQLELPARPRGVVLFAHGSGSSRLSPRNRQVAQILERYDLGTLLFDLLLPPEERHATFDIELLADRLAAATRWLRAQSATASLPLGYFGASTGAAAALLAASHVPRISAVVSRGGRPDLAGPGLPLVTAPTLLIVGGNDFAVIEMNRRALAELRAPKRLELIPGAGHLFEQPGALDAVGGLAGRWFLQCFTQGLIAPRTEAERHWD